MIHIIVPRRFDICILLGRYKYRKIIFEGKFNGLDRKRPSHNDGDNTFREHYNVLEWEQWYAR
jgi:hypothetical protein